MQETIKQPSNEDLIATAGSYHALGINVVPFKITKVGDEYEKKPLSNWRQWIEKTQTPEEFEALNWTDANGFAVILGTPNIYGKYLSVVDYDCKGTNVSDEIKEKGRGILKDFPTTQTEQTVNNGLHLIYFSRTKPKTIGTYHDTASLELLGEKKLCLRAPSLGYTKQNDNTPTEIEDIQQKFIDILKKHDVIKEIKHTKTDSSNRIRGFNEARPCITGALNLQLTGPNGHNMRLAIASEHKKLGYSDEEIINLFRNQPDFNYDLCRTQVESVDAEKTAKCTSIKEYGYCIPNCPKNIKETKKKNRHTRTKDEDENQIITSPGMATSDIIFEQAHNEENGNHYIIWDRKKQKIEPSSEIWRTYTIEETDYYPLLKLPWPSITDCSNYESIEKLYTELKKFIIEHLDVPNERYYDVYTCFILASWRAEDFKIVPYIFFLGPMASGKTRGLECLNQLCYRPIFAASISAASLFRVLEAWHPTLLLDETEIYNKENMAEVLSLLNSGYRRGQCALRVKGTEQGNPEIANFDVFGFKALAGTQELADTLQSRCIITAMSKAVRRLNIFVDEAKAQQLRNKLLLYRFLNLGTADDNMIVTFLQENQGFRNARVIELFISLLQVAPTQQIKDNLLELMKQITQSRLDAEQASIEARIFESIIKCESKVNCGKISTQVITEFFNEGQSEKDKVTSRFVGRRVAALGFEKCRVGDKGQAGFYYAAELINRLKARYFPNGLLLTSETSETPETSVSMEKQGLRGYLDTEVTEDKPLTEKSIKNIDLPSKTVVSEVTEDSEVKKEDTEKLSEGYQKGSEEDRELTKDFEHADREVNKQLKYSEKTTYFRHLAPNEPHPCDGLDHGRFCALEAKYLMGESNYYCEAHFRSAKRDCENNGYTVTELSLLPDGDDF